MMNTKTSLEHLRDTVLCGGRLTKFKGIVASVAPTSGVVIAPVLMATALTLGTPGGVQAGGCAETGGAGSGVWSCSGPPNAGTDSTQSLTPATGGAVDATTDIGFGIITTAGDAIRIYNTVGDTDITFTGDNGSLITGNERGIHARNYGTGALSLTSTGTVTGTTLNGIYARNDISTTDMTVIAVDVTGGTDGINAGSRGSGATIVTATGSVVGASQNGIVAVGSRGTDVTVTAADVTGGGRYGILAFNEGAGVLSVTSSGTVTGAVGGVFAQASGTDLTVVAADVTGGINGIEARNFGTGATSVMASGSVIGATGNGVEAYNFFGGGSGVTVTAVDVTGGTNGIHARNYGSGALSVTSTGIVTGTADDGIYTHNADFGATELTITAVDVTGGTNGIRTRNYGSGALSVTSSGTVTGTTGNGIEAFNRRGRNLTVSAVDVIGGNNGIAALNLGAGDLSVTSIGTVTGTAEDGIYANNSSAGTDLTVTAVDVTGGTNGIRTRNYGRGALNVISSGAVTGRAEDGIYANNSSAGTDLTVTAVDVTGGLRGVYASNYGTAH